jgi:hypothetical protein
MTPKVDRILAVLPDNEAALLLRALEDPQVSNMDISRVLTRHGHTVEESSIRRWRKQRAELGGRPSESA